MRAQGLCAWGLKVIELECWLIFFFIEKACPKVYNLRLSTVTPLLPIVGGSSHKSMEIQREDVPMQPLHWEYEQKLRSCF